MVAPTHKQEIIEDPQELRAHAERWLSGHGFESVRTVLANLLEDVGPEERQDQYGTGAIIEEFEREVAELLLDRVVVRLGARTADMGATAAATAVAGGTETAAVVAAAGTEAVAAQAAEPLP